MSALYLIVGLLCGLPIGWSLRSHPKPEPDRRLDRTIASLQREAMERGKLARRLAQAETKIARLQKPKVCPVSLQVLGGQTLTVCSLCLGTGKVFHENPPRKDTPYSRCHCQVSVVGAPK